MNKQYGYFLRNNKLLSRGSCHDNTERETNKNSNKLIYPCKKQVKISQFNYIPKWCVKEKFYKGLGYPMCSYHRC